MNELLKSGEENIGSLLQVFYVLPDEILNFPFDSDLPIVGNTLTLIANKSWKKIDFTLDSMRLSSPNSESDQGDFYATKVIGAFPNDSVEADIFKGKLKNKEVVLKVKLGDGRFKIVGSKINPLQIRFASDTSTARSGYKGIAFEFTHNSLFSPRFLI